MSFTVLVDELTRQTQSNRGMPPTSNGTQNMDGASNVSGTQNVPTGNSDDVPDLLNLSREARRRYEQFCHLSGQGPKGISVAVIDELVFRKNVFKFSY